MLINFSNHPCIKWSAGQTNAAIDAFGSIVDYIFPAVDPELSSEEVLELAERCAAEIASLAPDAVLCQGEFSLAFEVAVLLLKMGIRVVCACSKRDSNEELGEDGETKKTIRFKFAGFRDYLLPASI